MGQGLGDAMAGELPVLELLDVLGAARSIGLAVEDDVEGEADRLLGRQVPKRDGGDEAVENPIGPLLPFAGRHRTILVWTRRAVVRTRSAPDRCAQGGGGESGGLGAVRGGVRLRIE